MAERSKTTPNRRTPKPHKKVLVISPTYIYCFREMLRGIGNFAKAKATWRMYYFTPNDNVLGFIEQEKPDALLFGSVSDEMLAETSSRIAHAVGFCNPGLDSQLGKISSVVIDDTRVGEVAADYFIKKQYENFAFIGHHGEEKWSVERQNGFDSQLRKSGFKPHVLLPDWEPVVLGRGWKTPFPNTQLLPFITQLPKPVAILACNDIRGREIVEACKNASLRIPEDVAVLGVDNDHLDCDLCSPALSSISIPWHQVGYQAAQKLDNLMEKTAGYSQIAVPPIGVVERQSTDSIAISDSDVSAALRYIREHAHVVIGVEDVLNVVTTGRRSLEKKFNTLLRRTLHDEIRRVHLDRAKYLLAHTEMTIAEIAAQSGYTNFAWFCKSFQASEKVSPGQYRKHLKK